MKVRVRCLLKVPAARCSSSKTMRRWHSTPARVTIGDFDSLAARLAVADVD